MQDQTRAVVAVLGSRLDPRACDEVAERLDSEPYLGSALDVFEAVGDLLPDDAADALSHALFDAIGGTGRPSGKRPKLSAAAGPGPSFLDQAAWKREFKSHAERFEQPFRYELRGEPSRTLVLEQRPFCPEGEAAGRGEGGNGGFASTVWDSSIVLARFLEREGHERHRGSRCVELGAGCGLPGLVLAALGARATLTDLPENLPLLRANAEANAASAPGAECLALPWGDGSVEALRRDPPDPPELILATDVLYSHDGVEPLVATLAGLAREAALARQRAAPAEWRPARVLIAAGRNRHAGDEFFRRAREAFEVHAVGPAELDPVYQCADVEVWSLHLRRAAASRSRDT